MVTTLGLLTFVVLFCVSALHAYWAFGGRWPGEDDLSLARTVVGTGEMPSASLTLVVAALIFLASLLPLVKIAPVPSILSPSILPPVLTQTGLALLTAVFGLRGLVTYTPIWRLKVFEEPFATLDRRYFGPLCILLGMAFGVLLLV